MNVIIENGNPVIAKLQGRLDTAAAVEITPDFENLSQYADKQIIIDCEQLAYISSSGLRLLLSLRKDVAAKGGKLQIRSLSKDILQVFQMTGFVSLFDIA